MKVQEKEDQLTVYHSEERLTMRDGIEILIRWIGPRQPRATMLFVHGATGESRPYIPIGRRYAALGLRVGLLDMRGHGESGGLPGAVAQPDSYARDFAECVVKISERLGEGVIVAGHSSGGNVILNSLLHVKSHHIAGFFFAAPTFAGDNRFVKTAEATTAKVFALTFRMKYTMPPPPAPLQSRAQNTVNFSVRGFLLSTLGFISPNTKVLSFRPVPGTGRFETLGLRDEPYSYTAKALRSFLVIGFEKTALLVDKPILMVMAQPDPFVDSRAVAMALRWALPPTTPVEIVVTERGGHFTALNLALPHLQAWCDRLWPMQEPTGIVDATVS